MLGLMDGEKPRILRSTKPYQFWNWMFVIFFLLILEICVASMRTGDREALLRNSNSTQSIAEGLGEKCTEVRRAISAMGIGIEIEEMPLRKIHDTKMRICYDGKDTTLHESCCTKKIEQKLNEASVKGFQKSIHEKTSYLKNQIHKNVVSLQEEFQKMVNAARASTDALFVSTYKIPAKDRKPPMDTLFMDLQQYLRMQDVNVHDSVAQFFDNLFPLVFHNILNDPTVTEFSADYHECLMEIRQQVYPRPFGDAPHKLSHLLAKSLSAARVYLNGLQVAHRVINITDFAAIEKRCSHALTRLNYCSYCEGEVAARPCPGYCRNVMQGCTSLVADLDAPWKDFVASLMHLSGHLSGTYSMDNVLLKSVHTKVDEGIMHAMEHSYKFYDKVVQRCGYPQTSGKKTLVRNKSSTVKNVDNRQTWDGMSLVEHIKAMLASLNNSRNFYQDMMNGLCDHSAKNSKESETCWNGESMVSPTLEANSLIHHYPHMKKPSESTDIEDAKEKLKMLTQQIHQLNRKGSQDDGVFRYNAGSGDNFNNDLANPYGRGDDEDSYGTSGSGSGGGNYYPYVPANNHKYNTYKIRNKKKSNYDKKNFKESDISFEDDDVGFNSKTNHKLYKTNSHSVRDGNNGAARTISSCFSSVLFAGLFLVAMWDIATRRMN